MWIWIVTILVGGATVYIVSKYHFGDAGSAERHFNDNIDGINEMIEAQEPDEDGIVSVEIVYRSIHQDCKNGKGG